MGEYVECRENPRALPMLMQCRIFAAHNQIELAFTVFVAKRLVENVNTVVRKQRPNSNHLIVCFLKR